MIKTGSDSSFCCHAWLRMIMLSVVSAVMLCGGAISARSAERVALADTPLTALRVFADIPLDVLDMLRPSTRLDMIDYYEQADSLLNAPNALGGKSRFLEVADDYLRVEVTSVSTLEIKILPFKKNKRLVMTLYTVGTDDGAKDTEVRFFDELLNPVSDNNLIKFPDLTRFFNLKESGVSKNELKKLIPVVAVKYSTGPGDASLTADLTSWQILPNETKEMLESHFIPSLNATWKGSYKFSSLQKYSK